MRVLSEHRRSIVVGGNRLVHRSIESRASRGKGLRPMRKAGILAPALDSNNPGSTTEILPTHTAALFNSAVKRAAEELRSGAVVGLPTETVYGLAANALDAVAVQKIFEIKGRPRHNPVIVHVVGDDMARRCTAHWPKTANALARAFWPGPLTLVLPRSKQIPDAVTAGGSTVGVRWPSHPFMQAVIRECEFPLAAPSANLSNRVSPTNASHVFDSLRGKFPLIVDGGQSQVGIESTVVDLVSTPPRILRPGLIHRNALNAALAECGVQIDEGKSEQSGTLRSPGQLPKHYSPRARLVILPWRDDADLRSKIERLQIKMPSTHVIAHTVIPTGSEWGRVSVIPHDAEAFARAIYAELHACDAAGAEWIIVEQVPETGEWDAIADRLRRASA